MRKTKDQRELSAILAQAITARDSAYSLFSRRLDTQQNVESFIGLRDALVLLRQACEVLESAVDEAIEDKSSQQNSVMDEIMGRSGKAVIVQDDEYQKSSNPKGPALILDFPKK